MTAPTLVVRDDLSRRSALSKSEVTSRTFCTVASFYSHTQPRPWQPNPDMTFGSAVDAGVEQLLKAARSGQSAGDTPRLAAEEVIDRDDQPVDIEEVMTAVRAFERDIVPSQDWSLVGLQVTLDADFGFGLVNGHPDIVNGPHIRDVKTSKRAKQPSDLWAKPELAIYAALYERASGETPESVGYLTWVRVQRPYWQPLDMPVTRWPGDRDLIDFGTRELRRQANLRRQFDAFAAVDPCDWFEGPAWESKCMDCSYRDICTTGRRNVARLGASSEAA